MSGLLERRCRVQGERMRALEAPAASTLTSVVTPAARSRTNISGASLVSPFTRSLAAEANATNWPLDDTEGQSASALPPPIPVEFTLTRTVLRAARSRRKTLRKGERLS